MRGNQRQIFAIGIVHAVDPPSLEGYVIDLVKSFIKPENTVILIAMPMTSMLYTSVYKLISKFLR